MVWAQRNEVVAGQLVLAVFLWGANNVAVKMLVTAWPPVTVACGRFLCAGLVLAGLFRWTPWLGAVTPLRAEWRRSLRLCSLGLAVYIVLFNWALHFTSPAHMALYLGASPVWALVLDWKQPGEAPALRRLAAAALALTGVILLAWPAARGQASQAWGEALAFGASVMWTQYSRLCRTMAPHLSGLELTRHTMIRSAWLLLPLSLVECSIHPPAFRPDLLWVFAYSVLGGAVISFACWNGALRYWPMSRVVLFNNLIPVCTGLWAYVLLGESLTTTFWLAMLLVVAAVAVGQSGRPRPEPSPTASIHET